MNQEYPFEPNIEGRLGRVYENEKEPFFDPDDGIDPKVKLKKSLPGFLLMTIGSFGALGGICWSFTNRPLGLWLAAISFLLFGIGNIIYPDGGKSQKIILGSAGIVLSIAFAVANILIGSNDKLANDVLIKVIGWVFFTCGIGLLLGVLIPLVRRIFIYRRKIPGVVIYKYIGMTEAGEINNYIHEYEYNIDGHFYRGSDSGGAHNYELGEVVKVSVHHRKPEKMLAPYSINYLVVFIFVGLISIIVGAAILWGFSIWSI